MFRRKYQNPNDQLLIRRFLQEVFLLNGRHELSWPLYRWDYWYCHVNTNIYHFDPGAAVFVWQDQRERLAAVLNLDKPGEACLQVHPDFRSAELEVEMMSEAETQYAVTQPDGRQKLVIWCPAGDSLRRDILRRRGYTRQAPPECQHRRDSSLPLAEAPLPPGYTIRPLDGPEELPARSWLAWKVFRPDEPDQAYPDWEWYRNVQSAPLYCPGLDLVAVSAGGEMAAFCTLWYDPITRSAAIEPAGTHPAHRRRGLGKALLLEGVRRAHASGATLVTASTTSEAVSALCASAGFTECDLSEPWMKQW